MGATKMEEMSWRITPMTVLPDIAQAYEQYTEIGFVPVAINVPGCHVLRAGDSYIVLASTECLEADYKPETVARLAGRTVPYIYVRSLDAAKAKLGEKAKVLEQVSTGRFTVEALMERAGNLMILAQQTQA